MAEKLRIDPIFRGFIPELLPEERQQLEANIVESGGARDALIAWPHDGHLVLVDGHNRHSICEKHGLPYKVSRVEFPDRAAVEDWIDRNQLGRRNLSTQQRMLLIGRRYNRTKKQGNRTDLTSDKTCQKSTTAERIAKDHGVHANTVRNAGKFQAAAEKLGIEKSITTGAMKAAESAVVKAAKSLPEKPSRVEVKAVVQELKAAPKRRRSKPAVDVFKPYPPTKCLEAVSFYAKEFLDRCPCRKSELEDVLIAILAESVGVYESKLIDAVGHVRPLNTF
jgi:hypothetical protein